MLNLIQNEWIKIFKQVSTYLMIVMLLVIHIAFAGLAKYIDNKSEPVQSNWKEELQVRNQELIEGSKPQEGVYITPSLREFNERQIALNDYRISHDIPPESTYSMWSFIQESSSLITFAGLFVIVIASGIVANEFSRGTIKVLLTKPYKRWKILLAKYITSNLFLLLMLGILFVTASIAGLILFGKGDPTSNVHLAFVNGEVVEQGLLGYLLKTYALESLSIFLLTAMAFMISSVFRNSSVAIGISIFLLMTGGTVTNLLAGRFEWAKYSLFANTNLMQYFDGMPLVDGMTLSFSIIMVFIYFAIFHLLAFGFFTKRDVIN